jgi:KipI family sensor histidine kinase inhibitor
MSGAGAGAVRPAGDRASLIELPGNDAALRLGRALLARGDYVDVVVGHRTVLVTWEHAQPELDLQASLATPTPIAKEVELRVRYDGVDLGDVAAHAGVSPEEVVARHARPEYVVGFVGFQPGFAYLLGGDELLAVPRLDEPRTRVPAGSVAVAGPYSGVYPRSSPGGWRLLGSTTTVLFDAAREPPALLVPGDRVRFVAV